MRGKCKASIYTYVPTYIRTLTHTYIHVGVRIIIIIPMRGIMLEW